MGGHKPVEMVVLLFTLILNQRNHLLVISGIMQLMAAHTYGMVKSGFLGVSLKREMCGSGE
jgi:hypothetical protein